MSTKLICTVTRCGWHGTVDDVLKSPSPFDDEELWACPNCKSVESLKLACDEPDCWKAVECGAPTPEGYKSTCSEHAPIRITSPYLF